jgi:hypothetical protein
VESGSGMKDAYLRRTAGLDMDQAREGRARGIARRYWTSLYMSVC